MPVYHLGKDSIDLLLGEGIAVIDFWAEWCGPCKNFSPIFVRVSDRFPYVKFAKINIEEEPEIAEEFHVRSIPHVVIVKDGVLIYSESGAMPEAALRDLVQQAIDTDVSKLKKGIEGEFGEEL
ncbi:thioredoxin family protein [Legionella israelensis]|uniref:thioredoxin family protein n=1 Tax=Legionella israelensis TaxID=454 RepID=UPI00117C96A5|nr:thioredoxin family protein [Legionella israelensis]QDP72650.1 thioredoxin family protein [Legionella israelensis]